MTCTRDRCSCPSIEYLINLFKSSNLLLNMQTDIDGPWLLEPQSSLLLVGIFALGRAPVSDCFSLRGFHQRVPGSFAAVSTPMVALVKRCRDLQKLCSSIFIIIYTIFMVEVFSSLKRLAYFLKTLLKRKFSTEHNIFASEKCVFQSKNVGFGKLWSYTTN